MFQLLLQAPGGGGGSALGSFLPFILILVVMYFFFMRPQMKKQKEEKKFRESLAKGMRIVTNSGIHGKILDLQETTLTLETENARLKLERSAVSKEMSTPYLPKEETGKKETAKK